MLGLPVPGIFLVREPDNKLLVLDGQQRLRTLQNYHKGIFRGNEFKLDAVRTGREIAVRQGASEQRVLLGERVELVGDTELLGLLSSC